jgi:hypothetical protein
LVLDEPATDCLGRLAYSSGIARTPWAGFPDRIGRWSVLAETDADRLDDH